MFIIASCVIGVGFEVEASGKAIVWENSPLGSRVRVVKYVGIVSHRSQGF